MLHGDFFFKKGHWHGLLRDPSAQVYAIAWAPTITHHKQQLVGLAVTHEGTTLHNLYLDPFWRNQGLGSTVLQILEPETIRAKTDMVAGNPVPFYEQLGYKVIQEEQGKNGNITVLQRFDNAPRR